MTAQEEQIRPDALYPFVTAARLIPSPRGDQGVSTETLHRWTEQGLIEAEYIQRGSRRYWFLRGSEILRLQQTEKHQPGDRPERRMGPTRSQVDHERAMQSLRERGVKC